MKLNFKISFLFLPLLFSFSSSDLSSDFYTISCPNVELLVKDTIRFASSTDPSLLGKLVRLLFHDCIVEVTTFLYVFWGHLQIDFLQYRCFEFIIPLLLFLRMETLLCLGGVYLLKNKKRKSISLKCSMGKIKTREVLSSRY